MRITLVEFLEELNQLYKINESLSVVRMKLIMLYKKNIELEAKKI